MPEWKRRVKTKRTVDVFMDVNHKFSNILTRKLEAIKVDETLRDAIRMLSRNKRREFVKLVKSGMSHKSALNLVKL